MEKEIVSAGGRKEEKRREAYGEEYRSWWCERRCEERYPGERDRRERGTRCRGRRNLK